MLKNKLFLLEHEILKTILEKNSITAGKVHRIGTPTIPYFQTDYKNCSLHYGTLVDILNNPEKYTDDKSLSGGIATREDITLRTHSYKDVSDAIEVLVYNGHVRLYPENELDHHGSNQIYITPKGAIDFRTKYYWKEYDKIMSIERNYEIQKMDRWQKKFWIFVNLSKYIIAATIGAAITWFFTRQ